MIDGPEQSPAADLACGNRLPGCRLRACQADPHPCEAFEEPVDDHPRPLWCFRCGWAAWAHPGRS